MWNSFACIDIWGERWEVSGGSVLRAQHSPAALDGNKTSLALGKNRQIKPGFTKMSLSCTVLLGKTQQCHVGTAEMFRYR